MNEAGLHACYNLLLFNPDSTLEDVAENLRFLRQHADNPMNFCRTEVYAGTPLERRLARQGRLIGDHWGRSYEIADPRAQRAFELALDAFSERNFGTGPTALHHLAMRVDYEAQLLSHFGGGARLRPAVKDFVRRVNTGTCALLEELVARLGATRRLPGTGGSFARELACRVAEENRRLGAEGTALGEELRAAALERSRAPDGRWARRAAAAGLAATLSLAGGCPRQEPGIGTHPTEMVAAPLEGDPKLVRDPLFHEVLPRIAKLLSRPVDVVVVATFGPDAVLAACTFTAGSGEPQPCPKIHLNGGDAATGRRFRVRFSAEEVERVRRASTQIYEEAPRPRRPDAGPSQMKEMAPRPTHPSEMAPRPRPVPKKPPPKKAQPKRPPTYHSEMAPIPILPRKKLPASEE